jgi:Surface-adhesin protein E
MSAYTGASGADWRFYAKSEFGSYCYDTESISRLSNHLVRVWQKLILNNKGTVNLVGELGKEYEKASEAIILREIDCINKKSRTLQLTFYSEEGRVIKKESYDPFGWDSIIPESVDDVLYCAICN